MDASYFNNLLIAGLPIWILTAGGLLCLIFDALYQKARKIVYAIGISSVIIALWVSAHQWVYPIKAHVEFLVMDPLTSFFILLISFIGLISLFNIYSYIKVHQGAAGISYESVSLILFSLVGMIFLFASTHLIIIFIGLETMSLAIYLLVGSQRSNIRSNEASMKYFVMGSVASAVLLFGMALFYGSYGSFDITAMLSASLLPNQVMLSQLAFVLLISGLLFKVACAPFHFWVPDVYEGSPSPITGFMAAAVKVSVFALFLRILTHLNIANPEVLTKVLTVSLVLTLLIGNLGAIAQDNVKRMLAYSSIAHAGLLLLGIVVGLKSGSLDAASLQAVAFYLVAYSVMSLGAFGVLSVMVKDKKEVTQFVDLTGLGYSRPVLALLFSLFMISLLGIPGTIGFMAKYGVFSYAIQNGYIALSVVAILATVISTYYYLRPIVVMYFKGEATQEIVSDIPFPLMFSLVFTAASVLYLGLNPNACLKLTQMLVGG